MSESYIVINGKRIDLTPERLATLGIEAPKKSPFEQQKAGDRFYYIDIDGRVEWMSVGCMDADDELFAVANYCADENLMTQRALREILNRRLWRYSMEHDGDKIDWKYGTEKFSIDLIRNNILEVNKVFTRCCLGGVHFHTEEIAKAAIDEIIKPFMKEHPEFKW